MSIILDDFNFLNDFIVISLCDNNPHHSLISPTIRLVVRCVVIIVIVIVVIGNRFVID